jgi:pimeloyl-ACP methyl ester carboxylesterase
MDERPFQCLAGIPWPGLITHRTGARGLRRSALDAGPDAGWRCFTLRLVFTTFDAGNNRTLSYQRRGSGPLVICLPGGPGMDPEAYFAAMDLPAYELLIFAPRGTGASTAPANADGYRSRDMLRIWSACACISASTR